MAVERLTPTYHILVNQQKSGVGKTYTRGSSSLLFGDALTRLVGFENTWHWSNQWEKQSITTRPYAWTTRYGSSLLLLAELWEQLIKLLVTLQVIFNGYDRAFFTTWGWQWNGILIRTWRGAQSRTRKIFSAAKFSNRAENFTEGIEWAFKKTVSKARMRAKATYAFGDFNNPIETWEESSNKSWEPRSFKS